jgi:F-type H+-transporting ATPase subunit b
MMRTTDLAAGSSANPLLPNGTFIVEAIIFGVVLLVIWRWVVPPIKKAMAERHDRAQKAIEDNNEATARYRQAEERLTESLHEARAESTRIRDEARAEGQRILDGMRDEARAESDRIQRRGAAELAAQREQAVSELDPRVGEFATTLANRVTGEDVSSSSGYRAEVDAFSASHRNGGERT